MLLGFYMETVASQKLQESGHGVSISTAGVSALAHDLFNYENSSQVPDRLSQCVASSKKAQAKWYNKLLQAWKAAKPQPKTAEQASRLVIQTLKGHPKADVEGLLKFYGLPLPYNWIEIPVFIFFLWQTFYVMVSQLETTTNAVGDEDGLTVYVDAADPSEAPSVPQAVRLAASRRSKARASRDYVTADDCSRTLLMLVTVDNENILAKKYRIRMRGIDAPEMEMPYGKEAKKTMLKEGHAWHYEQYDKRPEFNKWKKEARAARIGLWASPNPQKPWEWRKSNIRD
ncbi:hypothetical protein MKX01_005179 [Papaver californicum]|nr:hypothetical protein MKX01_005179 [Papaver californicum]